MQFDFPSPGRENPASLSDIFCDLYELDIVHIKKQDLDGIIEEVTSQYHIIYIR